MVILLLNTGLIHSILILFLKILFTQSGKINMVSSFEGLCKFDRSTEKFTRYKPSANAKFSDPNISVINEDSDGMIWVGSHTGGLCRFDRQTGKFLPEYFDLGYHQSQGDKAGLKDNVHCMYKDRGWYTMGRK